MTSMGRGVACNYLLPWAISWRSFSHEFAIKLLNYVTSCHIRSTTCTVLDEILPYLAQMITSMKKCIIHNDLWPWSISSRLFHRDFELLKYVTSCHICSTACTALDGFFPYSSLAWEGVSYAVTLDFDLYLRSYLAVTLPIAWIIFICGTNTTHEGTMCHVLFQVNRLKVKVTQVIQISVVRAGGILVDQWSTNSSFN